MRTAVTVRLDRPITEAAELARRAEDLGFDGIWVADHYFHRDAGGALALMAAATSRAILGTAVMSPLCATRRCWPVWRRPSPRPAAAGSSSALALAATSLPAS